MDIGGIVIDFEPGDSFEQKRLPAGGMRSPDADERHDAREQAVKQFRENAIKTTQLQLQKPVGQVIALLIQLRALGGRFDDTPLKDQLKETVEFMEDL